MRQQRRSAGRGSTFDRILDVTERLVQRRGYNGFSYADVAAEIGISTASLHYHFPSKGDLGAQLLRRYQRRFAEALQGIEEQEDSAAGRLRAYAELYASVLRDERMCLCGMLASDQRTLPAPMRRGVKVFFDLNDAWLKRVLEAGRGSGELRFDGTPLEAGRALFAAFEGAMLVASAREEPERFEAAARHLFAQLFGGGASAAAASGASGPGG